MARPEDLLKHPDRLSIRRFGGKGTVLFGLVFAGAGVAALVTSLYQEGFYAGPVLFSLLFVAIGMGFGLSRSEVILDRQQHLAVSWWGLLRPMRVKSRPIDDLHRVVIAREVRTSSSSKGGQTRYVVYPVHLDGDNAERLGLGEFRNLMDARRRAEEVAKFLSLPLHDHSDGDSVRIRDSATLDEPLRARLRREGNTPLPGPPPEGSGLRIEERAGRFSVRVPVPIPLFSTLFLLVFAVAPLIFIWLFYGEFDEVADSGFPLKLFLVVFLTIWMATTLLPLLYTVTRRERLLLTQGQMIFEKRWLLGKRVTKIPLDEIEELSITRAAGALGKKRVLSATSDAALIQVGGKLTEPALEWLKRRLTAAIAAS